MGRETRKPASNAPKVSPRDHAPVVVGEVTVSAAAAPPASTRASRLDSEPVAVAVRDAVDGQWYDISHAEGKAKEVTSILRRAGQRFNKGLRIVPQPGNVIKFRTGDKRVVNKGNGVNNVSDSASES